MEKSRVYFLECVKLLGIKDAKSPYWKTCQLSLTTGLQTYVTVWPKSGMMQSGKLYQLGNLARRICVKGGFSLPTPTALPYGSNTTPNGKKRPSLATLAKNNMLNLPTPLSRIVKDTLGTPSIWRRNTSIHREIAIINGLKKETIGKKARLRPQFVTWMMGFPIGWLDLEP